MLQLLPMSWTVSITPDRMRQDELIFLLSPTFLLFLVHNEIFASYPLLWTNQQDVCNWQSFCKHLFLGPILVFLRSIDKTLRYPLHPSVLSVQFQVLCNMQVGQNWPLHSLDGICPTSSKQIFRSSNHL